MDEVLYNKNVTLSEEERYLSLVETMFYSMNKTPPQSEYFHALKMKCKRTLGKEEIRSAFLKLTHAHYLLRCCVQPDQNGDLRYMKSESFADESWVKVITHQLNSETEWSTVVHEEMKRGFDFDNGPLWVVLWLQLPKDDENQKNDDSAAHSSGIMVFISFHGICDGVSINDLMVNQLMPLLNDATVAPKPALFCQTKELIESTRPFVKFSERQTPWYIRYPLDIGEYFYRGSAKEKRYMEADVRRDTNRCPFLPFHIEPQLSRKLIGLCRENKCSVHAVVSMVLLSSVKRMVKTMDIPESAYSKVSFPIDIRRFVKQLEESPLPLGCYTTNGVCKPAANAEKVVMPIFFDDARKLTTEIRKQIKMVDTRHGTVLLNTVSHLLKKQQIDDFNRMISPYPLLIFTNIGNCGYSDDCEKVKGNMGIDGRKHSRAERKTEGEELNEKNDGENKESDASNMQIDKPEKKEENALSKKSSDDFTIDRQFFAAYGNDVLILSLVTFNDTMGFCVSYDVGWFEEEKIQQLTVDMREMMSEIVKDI